MIAYNKLSSYFSILREGQSDLITKIPNVSNPKEDFVYILDWIAEDQKRTIYAIGVNIKNNRLCKFKAPFKSHLYVWAQKIQDVALIIRHIKYCDVTIDDLYEIPDKFFKCNNITPLDDLLGNDRSKRSWKLFRIPTLSYTASKQLYNMINYSISISYKIATLGSWSLETMILMEFYYHRYNQNTSSSPPCFFQGTLMNQNLEIMEHHQFLEKPFDVLSFDIETISNDSHRVPMGECKADIIYSVSVTRYISSKDLYIHETIFNLPIKEEGDVLTKAKEMIYQEEKYIYDLSRNITIVNSEENLLSLLFSIFDATDLSCKRSKNVSGCVYEEGGCIDTPYLLLGFNSKGYDMPFLLKRATYLNMNEMNNFYAHNGILTYGLKMLHIDMQQVIITFHAEELTSFSLSNVVKCLLKNAKKIDFDSRNLRFIYEYMMKHGLGDGKYSHDNNIVSLSSMALYNDIDSILVLQLWKELHYENFLKFASTEHHLPLARISLVGISEYLNNKIIHEGLLRDCIFTSHHNQQITCSPNTIIYTNLDMLAASSNTSEKYGGGFNYRDEKGLFSRVVSMDMVAYYPQMIDGFNLSHETTLIFTVGGLKQLITTTSTVLDNLVNNYAVYRFCNHKDIEKNNLNIKDENLVDNVTSKHYVYGFLDNGSIINPCLDLDKLPNTERLLIINKNVIGILSKVVKDRNALRNAAKAEYKIIEQFIEDCRDALGQLENTNNNNNNNNDDNDDDDDDDDDDVAGENG